VSRWRSIWLVARRELMERGRSKAFLVSLALTVAFILAGIFLPSILGGDDEGSRLGIVGPTPAGLEASLQSTADAIDMTLTTEAIPDLATGEARLADESLDGLLVFPPDGSTPAYVVKRASDPVLQQVVAASFSPAPQITFRELDPADPDQDVSFIFANVGVILLFISIFTFGTWVLTGVVEEKQSRVVEVVLSTVSARDLLIGKVLGIGLLGLAQLIVMVGVGIGVGTATGRFELPATTAGAVVQLFVWFGLGYAFYSTALGVLGALASRMEEASNASAPVSILASLAYVFALLVALDNPSGIAAQIASFLPPVAPMVVPLRAALGAIEPWEIIVSILLMVAAIWGLFVIGGRVYSGAVLETTGRVGLRDAWRASRR
jgi:ABC-2 type transport system permease protein